MGMPLVVGGGGFIGSALVRLLAADGPVRVLDDLSTGKKHNVADVTAAELIVGSLLDPDVVDKALDGVDVVFHLACLGVRHSIAHPIPNHDVNATGTLGLLEACRQHDVRRFVYTSTSEVYGTGQQVPMPEEHPARPHTVYGGSKLAGEAYVRAYHQTYEMETVVLRPFNAYGPRSHHEGDSGEVIPKFLVRLKNGLPPIVFGDGTQTRDFTWVEDTVQAIASAGTSPKAVGQTINIGSGREIQIRELARMTAEVVGRTDIAAVHAPARPADVLRLCADSRRADDLLGWSARTGLKEGLESLLAWHDQQGRDWAAALQEDVERNWES